MEELKNKIEYYYEKINSDISEIDLELENFLSLLNNGKIRAAEKSGNEWNVNLWVKKGILLIFRRGILADMSINADFKYFDKHNLTLKNVSIEDNVRIVPGGSSIRTGVYLAKGVICMPPMYINIGSYIDEGTMIDSHALVGTCAQVGKRVHISAAAQIGGVLEPAGARPVIIEDNVMIGGNCGVYEGIIIRERAVLGSGVILTASTKVFDLVNETIITSNPGKPLEIPASAVLVSGSRNINTDFGKKHGLSIYSPMIIKYRDEKTDAKTALTEDLR
jgi:2,3,4,5-tetrahydropyridine-2-carboxylate N-succinyltransferase